MEVIRTLCKSEKVIVIAKPGQWLLTVYSTSLLHVQVRIRVGAFGKCYNCNNIIGVKKL